MRYLFCDPVYLFYDPYYPSYLFSIPFWQRLNILARKNILGKSKYSPGFIAKQVEDLSKHYYKKGFSSEAVMPVREAVRSYGQGLKDLSKSLGVSLKSMLTTTVDHLGSDSVTHALRRARKIAKKVPALQRKGKLPGLPETTTFRGLHDYLKRRYAQKRTDYLLKSRRGIGSEQSDRVNSGLAPTGGSYVSPSSSRRRNIDWGDVLAGAGMAGLGVAGAYLPISYMESKRKKKESQYDYDRGYDYDYGI